MLNSLLFLALGKRQNHLFCNPNVTWRYLELLLYSSELFNNPANLRDELAFLQPIPPSSCELRSTADTCCQPYPVEPVEITVVSPSNQVNRSQSAQRLSESPRLWQMGYVVEYQKRGNVHALILFREASNQSTRSFLMLSMCGWRCRDPFACRTQGRVQLCKQLTEWKVSYVMSSLPFIFLHHLTHSIIVRWDQNTTDGLVLSGRTKGRWMNDASMFSHTRMKERPSTFILAPIRGHRIAYWLPPQGLPTWPE